MGEKIYGRIYGKSGKKLYEGFFKNQRPHGRYIKLFNGEGVLQYVGCMKEGRKYGFGISYNSLGKIEGRGFWDGDEINLDATFGIKYFINGQLNAIGCGNENE